ncbi:MAG: ATP-dependent helicase HrpB [Campylobacterota bacterium]|nr:ATP-dependent helicase HrpB [Campylobacterota bacterium]
MQNLPIYKSLDDIKSNFINNNTLILQAPPGTGKSTVVPISFLDEPWLENKIIIMLEPRRVAARMVASRMAQLLGEEVGQTVGYQVKMDRCSSSKTKVLVVTEAILVRMIQSDQSLQNVAMVIFDEFHERSIHTDLSLALSLQVQELLRDDLKILIMSATLNSNEIVNLLGDVPVITTLGKTFEVEDIYLKANLKQPDVRNINSTLLNITLNSIANDDGDILVFLSGVKEIKALEKSLNDSLKNSDENIVVLPLYSALSKKEQDRAILKNKKRKIILSTNIAQTSLTIDGVKVVIDSGLEKLSRYNYSNGMNHLELSFISKDSAIQRAGRAGRLSNGKCYKLWHQNKILTPSTKPEILRTDLSSLLLDLALWGVDEFDELSWLNIPDTKILEDTKEILQELQMLDDNFAITSFGKDALTLGLHPRYSFMILTASDMGYGYEACLLASMLSEKDIFKNSYSSCDIKDRFVHLLQKDIDNSFINRYIAKDILKQSEAFYTKLKKIKPQNRNKFDIDMIGVLVLFAYPDRLAKQRQKDDNRYKLSNAKGAILNIEDTLFNEPYLVVSNLIANNKDSYINLACSISLENIESYFSSFIEQSQTITFNKSKKKFDIKEHSCFLNLELYSTSKDSKSIKNFTELILNLIQKEGLEFLPWSKKAKDLKDKINFVNQHIKNNDFPDFSDNWLINNLDDWLKPYLEGINEIKELENLDIYSILLNLITWENQQLLNQLLPKSIKVPSGSNINIDYSNLEIPVLSVKLQEMFGLSQTPMILNNTVALQIQLLSPAMRPIAITYDLESFWKNSYDDVRKDLRGKYKRHYWPESPYDAVATNKTKKNMGKLPK